MDYYHYNMLHYYLTFYIMFFVSIVMIICLFLCSSFGRRFVKHKIVNVNDKKWNIKEIPMYCLYIPKRKEQVTKFFNDINLNVEYVQGPDKNTLDVNEFKEKGVIESSYKMSDEWEKIFKNGKRSANKLCELACHLGHISILEKFLETQEEWCIIFEDDVTSRFNGSEIVYLIEQTFNNLPTDCDILFLGYCHEDCGKVMNVYNSYIDLFNNKPNIYVKTGVRAQCTHSYVVNRETAQYILSDKRLGVAIDELVGDMLLNGKLIGYISTYVIFEQNLDDFESELGTDKIRPVCGVKNNIV